MKGKKVKGERPKVKGQKRRSWEDLKLRRRFAGGAVDWVESVN